MIASGTFQAEAAQYQQQRKAFWSGVYGRVSHSWGGYYHRRLQLTYGHLVPQGASVLELGCGRGDLLAALQPAQGVGVDFCAAALEKARSLHPDLEFVLADANDVELGSRTFDYIVVSDLVNDLWEIG